MAVGFWEKMNVQRGSDGRLESSEDEALGSAELSEPCSSQQQN